MHDAFHRAVRVVADRVAEFFGPMVEFRRIGNELARDRVVRIVCLDQRGQRGRQRHRIARGNRLQARRGVRAAQSRDRRFVLRF